MANKKRIYRFKQGKAEGNSAMKDLLGGKGANLAEMANLGLPVPPGFTITTETCLDYLSKTPAARKTYMKALMKRVMHEMSVLEKEMGYMPLVSVRSGARVSMPGMMDTILNVGVSSISVNLDARTKADCHRRFLQMYGGVVRQIPDEHFEEIINLMKLVEGVNEDHQINEIAMKALADYFEGLVTLSNDGPAPKDIETQLQQVIESVFHSWNNDRAKHYRKMHGYPEDWGTAVNVQAMVFGNANNESCSGVVFSRNPATGENELMGEFLPNAQGEDVVAGVRTPFNIVSMSTWNSKVFEELRGMVEFLDKHYNDMQDIEFTVQDGKLYLLQTRNAKRSGLAKLRIALKRYKSGEISREEFLKMFSFKDMQTLSLAQVEESYKKESDAIGIGAGGSVVAAKVAFSNESAVSLSKTAPVVLVRKETTPDDIVGMDAAEAILTTTGGATSHAAVVARGLNKTCVVGCTGLSLTNGMLGGKVKEGDWITVDGVTGKVWLEKAPVTSPGMPAEVVEILGEWVTDDTPVKVSSPIDAWIANTLVVEVSPSTPTEVVDGFKALKDKKVIFVEVEGMGGVTPVFNSLVGATTTSLFDTEVNVKEKFGIETSKMPAKVLTPQEVWTKGVGK